MFVRSTQCVATAGHLKHPVNLFAPGLLLEKISARSATQWGFILPSLPEGVLCSVAYQALDSAQLLVRYLVF